MTGHKDIVFEPKPANVAVYKELLALYRRLHDAFGIPSAQGDLADVMKRLLDLRDQVRAA
jgi:L-ribulokinase